jgi:hypothetical protein
MALFGGHWTRERRRWREETLATARAWQKEELAHVSAEIAGLTSAAVARELSSRDALNGRLASTITVCGALLAAAFALSKNAADLKIHGATYVLFSITFSAAVVLLVMAMLICVAAIQPDLRHRLNPALARYWARNRAADEAARTDGFRLDVALLDQVGAGNTRRASRLLLAQYFLVAALVAAAVGALVIFFA